MTAERYKLIRASPNTFKAGGHFLPEWIEIEIEWVKGNRLTIDPNRNKTTRRLTYRNHGEPIGGYYGYPPFTKGKDEIRYDLGPKLMVSVRRVGRHNHTLEIDAQLAKENDNG